MGIPRSRNHQELPRALHTPAFVTTGEPTGRRTAMADMSALKNAKRLLNKDPRFAHRKLSTVNPTRATEKKKRDLVRGVSEITAMIEKLKIEQSMLRKEIKADADGIEEYSGARGLIERTIEDCEARLKKNRATIKMFGEAIGPLETQYVELQKDSKVRFEDAKKFYEKAIQMLIDKFDYNPAFKRPGDQL